MTTLYDIGDEIEIRMRGKVVEYSASKRGDCYVVEIDTGRKVDPCGDTRVYLNSDMLARKSHKIFNGEE